MHHLDRGDASSEVADLSAPVSNSSIFFTSSTPATDLSRLILQHKDLLSRHQTCLAQLRKTFNEADTLRQENTNLRIANTDLNSRLNRLVDAYLESQCRPPNTTPEYVTPPLSSVRESPCESPTRRVETDGSETNVDRVSLPKSISVRSTGFLKTAGQPSPTAASVVPCRASTRTRPPILGDAPQKVHVRGGDKTNRAIELEVYSQGVAKTELCNKWQETGSCPYGENCQFAHGFGELRPVLRHPRYKTEVCRMVLAGDPCPYGHRCHFRHALTEQEKLVATLNLD